MLMKISGVVYKTLGSSSKTFENGKLLTDRDGSGISVPIRIYLFMAKYSYDLGFKDQ